MRRWLIALVALAALTVGGLFVWRYAWSGSDPAGDGGNAAALWLDRLAHAVGLGGSMPANTYSGYVEADYVMVTSSVGGTLMHLDVARGDQVEKGAPLFGLDDAAERAARDEATARLAQAQSQLADLQVGRRQPEIDAIVAQHAQAEAALRQSEADFERQMQLRNTRVSSQKQLDDARAQRDHDQSRLDELDAQLKVAQMPAREDEIHAAEAAVSMAQASLAQAEWRLGQKSGTAPAAALVYDTLYRPGEMAPAGLPVVQLLPPGNVKVRFFVPQAVVAQIAVGQTVKVSCDGCTPVTATVRFISPRAEYTPPVIYSREERSRLVFMIEARPTEHPEALRVGQPVDVVVTP